METKLGRGVARLLFTDTGHVHTVLDKEAFVSFTTSGSKLAALPATEALPGEHDEVVPGRGA